MARAKNNRPDHCEREPLEPEVCNKVHPDWSHLADVEAVKKALAAGKEIYDRDKDEILDIFERDGMWWVQYKYSGGGVSEYEIDENDDGYDGQDFDTFLVEDAVQPVSEDEMSEVLKSLGVGDG